MRFANNAIHQNVAEHGVTISIRTVVDGRTARVTTNRLDEDSLRAAVGSSLQLSHSQPKIPGLLPMPGKQHYRKVDRFSKDTAAVTPEDRARAGDVCTSSLTPGTWDRRIETHSTMAITTSAIR